MSCAITLIYAWIFYSVSRHHIDYHMNGHLFPLDILQYNYSRSAWLFIPLRLKKWVPRASRELMVKSKLSPCIGSITQRQSDLIHKRRLQAFLSIFCCNHFFNFCFVILYFLYFSCQINKISDRAILNV